MNGCNENGNFNSAKNQPLISQNYYDFASFCSHTVVPPYRRGILSKTPRGCRKPRIAWNLIYIYYAFILMIKLNL